MLTPQRSGFVAALAFFIGTIITAFGAVGLWENRANFFLHSVTIGLGLVLTIFGLPFLVKAAKQAAGSEPYAPTLGGSLFFIVWGCIRFAIKTNNNRPLWDQWSSVIFVLVGIAGLVILFRKRDKADSNS